MSGEVWKLIRGILDRAASSPKRLTFGARGHAVLAGGLRVQIAKAMRDADWTCHLCGICLPEMMEFDGGHGGEPVRPICQFCHNMDHPIWAAGRGRMVPVWAPDMDCAEISRLSWVLLALGQIFPDRFGEELDPGEDVREPVELTDEWRVPLERAARSVSRLREALENRRQLFENRFGRTTAEAFLEDVIVHRHRVGEARRERLLDGVRFVPAPVTSGYDGLPVTARVSAWGASGFEDMSGRIGPVFVAGLGWREGRGA